jgi:S-(hydroxymethyl)glutathione dehydrogenase/alcohol dehydrogenase
MGSYYGSASPHESFRKISDAYLKGKLDIESLITRSYSLDQINEGYSDLVSGGEGRGIIKFSS